MVTNWQQTQRWALLLCIFVTVTRLAVRTLTWLSAVCFLWFRHGSLFVWVSWPSCCNSCCFLHSWHDLLHPWPVGAHFSEPGAWNGEVCRQHAGFFDWVGGGRDGTAEDAHRWENEVWKPQDKLSDFKGRTCEAGTSYIVPYIVHIFILLRYHHNQTWQKHSISLSLAAAWKMSTPGFRVKWSACATRGRVSRTNCSSCWPSCEVSCWTKPESWKNFDCR